MKKIYRILVVDDEEAIRITTEIILSKEGYEVFTANGYCEALDIISKYEFDLIFVDVMLEDKTGFDVLQEIKKQNSTCPVVLFTAYPNIESASDALRLGAYDYISKPVSKSTLLNIVNLVIHNS